MAYFECVIGSGGGGGSTEIPLTVTCSSGFAGKTISCTKGSTTLTGTCPSSSPYTLVFKLPSAGTWTVSGVISGTTYSESVAVDSFDVELKSNIDKTVTVYSAANDTVSYTGLDGTTRTITTNSSGSASATITINPSGSTFTFRSSVAKNPSSLSSNYTKSITISSSTSSISVCPTGAIYWYGYKARSMSAHAYKSSAESTRTAMAPTVSYGTNSVTVSLNHASSQNRCGVLSTDSSMNMSSYSNFKAISYSDSSQGAALYVMSTNADGYTVNASENLANTSSSPSVTTCSVSSLSSSQYPAVKMTNTSGMSGTATATVQALWLE